MANLGSRIDDLEYGLSIVANGIDSVSSSVDDLSSCINDYMDVVADSGGGYYRHYYC